MIRRVEFENFMSLRNVSIDLKPLTVFVGLNGVGKSAIFKGLVVLSKLLRSPIRSEKGEFAAERGVTLDDLVWNGNAALPIKFRVWCANDYDEPGYTLELSKGPQGWGVTRERIVTTDGWIEVDETNPFEHPTERRGAQIRQPPLRATLRYLVNPYINDTAAQQSIDPIVTMSELVGTAWRYRPSADDVAAFVGHPTGDRPTHVAPNGYGVARELQTLQGNNRQLFEKIENALCRLFPHIKSLGFQTDWQGVRLSFMTNRSDKLIAAPQESDGVLLATFLLWRLYTGGPSMKICLEEPENGLHPFLLADRFRLLKQFAYPENEAPAVQLLVSTHSPEFLRQVKAHPHALWQELRIVEFDEESGTSVRGLHGYREAASLYGNHLDEIHERWSSLAQPATNA